MYEVINHNYNLLIMLKTHGERLQVHLHLLQFQTLSLSRNKDPFNFFRLMHNLFFICVIFATDRILLQMM